MEEKDKNKNDKRATDPKISYEKKDRIVIFNSLEEQEEYNARVAASLSPVECLEHMRKLIDVGFKLQGIDVTDPPKKHSIVIS
jgi:hypothetical protein